METDMLQQQFDTYIHDTYINILGVLSVNMNYPIRPLSHRLPFRVIQHPVGILIRNRGGMACSKGPQVETEPAAVRTEPSYMGHMLNQVSYPGAPT